MKPSIYWLFVFVPITVILEHAGKVPPPVIFFRRLGHRADRAAIAGS